MSTSNMRKLNTTIFCFVFFLFSHAQHRTDDALKKLFSTDTNSIFQKVISNPFKYRCQIIYTRIDRDQKNNPAFKNLYFNYDPFYYYYPASTVKLPLALLALEKINRLNIPGVNKFTVVQFDSTYERQKTLYRDTTAPDHRPSIAHLIKRAFLISENDPYNRLYQFVGQQQINRQLHKKGYTNTRILRQFMGYTIEQNKHTNAVRFLDKKGKLVYHQRAAYNADTFDFSRPVKIGDAHYNRNDSLIREPLDFTMHNTIPLEDLQQMLQSILFPASVHPQKRFGLKEDDYKFLYKYLSQYPSETDFPKYDDSVFYDSYVKFFFRNDSRRMPPGVRVFNKVGWSYGFLTDVSYVADFSNKIEYMLTATVYVNEDGILNDNKYEYNETGYPFLYQLGQVIYQHELKRKRNIVPDLSRFTIKYDKRDPKGTHPIIKEVDN